MKSTKHTSLAAVTFFSLALASSTVHAATFNLSYVAGDFSGLTAGTSKAILVIDTASDGFNGISDPNTNNTTYNDLSSFSFTPGSIFGDDYVLQSFTAENIGGGALGFQTSGGNPQAFTTSTSYAGKQMALYYFPTGSNALTNPFSYYRSNVITDGDIAYFVPGDGATNSLFSATTLAGGSLSSPITPSLSGTIGGAAPIPEPSRALLSMIGLALLTFHRRRP